MNQKGFIGTLLLIIIALILLKYFFNWSIFDAVASEQGRSTINYIKDVLSAAWSYTRNFLVPVWDKAVELLPARS